MAVCGQQSVPTVTKSITAKATTNCLGKTKSTTAKMQWCFDAKLSLLFANFVDEVNLFLLMQKKHHGKNAMVL